MIMLRFESLFSQLLGNIFTHVSPQAVDHPRFIGVFVLDEGPNCLDDVLLFRSDTIVEILSIE